MRVLAEQSTRDAAAVKVLTVITLVYLPVAVVSASSMAPYPQAAPTDSCAELLLYTIHPLEITG